ncbi:HAD family hydrolase [Robertmurraya korlensis]|uniref:HAD family hydrolase n=1 Tax=Robertmurraya korlensis TaxID=519977 RepID=UPI001E5A8179|nr:HAD family hydrolase [Robertmurraya korlensis]
MILIKAVVFDFDGLIIDTETVWFESFKEILGAYDVEFPLEIFTPCVGTHGTIIDQYIEEKLGKKVSVEEVRRRVRECHRNKIINIDARDGVRDYLKQAKELDLRIGLASSSRKEWIHEFLKKLDILHYFDVIKSSDDVKMIKPDPELYIQCTDALNVRSNEVVAFEDSNNGAKAANDAGIACVIVPNPITEGIIFDNYDLRIESMANHSLKDVLNRITSVC